MREFIDIASALSDPSRARLLMRLFDRELCVCSLVEFIGLADSTVSKHMSILKQAGLVESTKRGRWVYYRVADVDSSPMVLSALKFIQDHLSQDKLILGDNEKMAGILKNDDGTRCQPYAVACPEHEPVTTCETA